MKSFVTLLKNELKLNIRNMNMVIFAVIIPLVVLIILGFIYGTKPAADGTAYTFLEQSFGALLYFHLCWRTHGVTPCGIRIQRTKNFKAF